MASPRSTATGRLEWPAMNGEEPLFLGLDARSARRASRRCPMARSPTEARRLFSLLGRLDDQDAPLFAAALSLANWHRRHALLLGLRCADRAQSRRLVARLPRLRRRTLSARRSGGDHARHARRPRCCSVASRNIRRAAIRRWRDSSSRARRSRPRSRANLHEEAGIDVADVRYLASQPWPFPSSLMIGATARSARRCADHRPCTNSTMPAGSAATRSPPHWPASDGAPFLPPPSFAIARTLLEHWLATA